MRSFFLFTTLIFVSSLLHAEEDRFLAPPTDWSIDSPNFVPVVGLRPFREGGVRIEKEGRVVHNYGAGGAGITISWGAAQAAIDLVRPELARTHRVVIIGGGVIGLTTAYLLLKSGHSVRIYSEKLFPDNTSNIAGGLWSPISVDSNIKNLALHSYQKFRQLMQEGWPIRELPLFVTEQARDKSGLDFFYQNQDIFEIIPHQKIPIAGVQHSGFELQTFLIDMPLYMAKLIAENERMGLQSMTKKFNSWEEVEARFVPPTIIFNCTGLGACELARDHKMIPIRGDLIHIKKTEAFNPLNYPYMVFYGKNGTDYTFFRSGEAIIGGTFIKGDSSLQKNLETCAEKLRSFRSFFKSSPQKGF